jgi:RHS repeat-associated protein
MSGISSKAAGSVENKRKFNDGTELESKEFSDGSGLELYSTNFRSYDAQIGRFDQVDPLASAFENQSPYVFVSNNPLLFNDPSGLSETTPGVNPLDKNDNAILPEVIVSNKKPKPSGGNNWLGWPSSTSSERKQWRDNQNLYYNRKSAGQDVVQKGDLSSYSSSVSMYKSWDKAEKEYRQMSIGAVVAIASPVLIMAAPEVIAATQGAATLTTTAATTVSTEIAEASVLANYYIQIAANSVRSGALQALVRTIPVGFTTAKSIINISKNPIYINEKTLLDAVKFIISKQLPAGSLPPTNSILPSGYQGSLPKGN